MSYIFCLKCYCWHSNFDWSLKIYYLSIGNNAKNKLWPKSWSSSLRVNNKYTIILTNLTQCFLNAERSPVFLHIVGDLWIFFVECVVWHRFHRMAPDLHMFCKNALLLLAHFHLNTDCILFLSLFLIQSWNKNLYTLKCCQT